MAVTIEKSGFLIDLNVGLAAALGFLWPLGAQIDFLLAFGLGPFEFDLAIQFEASLALQASLSISISDPLLGLQLAIQAVAQLQAALQAALTLPTFSISIGAELSASIALAAALSAKLGNITLMIEAALAIKIPAIKLAMELALKLAMGPAFLLSFSGTDLATAGADINTTFAGGLVDPPNTILSTDPVWGIILVTNALAVGSSIDFLFGI